LPNKKRFLFGLGLNVIVLGVASMLTDISTEMIFPLFPLFTVEVLGASAAVIGLIEGIAESTASLLKVASGWWSDKIRRRKPIIVAGYGLSTIVKPALAAATSWPHALAVRFADRVGKGARTSPRDALIADSSHRKVRGKAFGLHRALDTTGAVIGPGIAFLLMWLLSGQGNSAYRWVFLIATIPAIIAVFVLVLFVKEVKGRKISRPVIKGVFFSPEFKLYLGIAAIFAIGNFSWAFFILAAKSLGIAAEYTILLYMFSNLIYALTSLPAGLLSDRVGRRPVIAFGYAIFGVTCVGFALVGSAWLAIFLFALYGLFKGITDGVQKAYVSDLVAPQVRGTAMGAFDTAVGLAAFPASFVVGIIWYSVGAWAAFTYGAVLSFAAAVLLIVAVRKR
jgi:MFS family permease